MKKSFILFFLLISAATQAFEFPGEWKIQSQAPVAGRKTHPAENAVSAAVRFPGSFLAAPEQARYSFRPSENLFNAETIRMDVKPEGTSGLIKAWLFLKDKDGTWFQSIREFHLKSGIWNTLEAPLTSTGFLPIGHSAEWSGLFAGRIFSAGVSLCSDESGNGRVWVRRPVFCGKRKFAAPEIKDWEMPSGGEKYIPVISRFQLTREYFNPFDDEKISVDFEVKHPSGTIETYPAFFSADFLEKHHFTQETVKMTGHSFWEFRFIPKQAGTFYIRICGLDRTGKAPVHFKSEWRKLQISDNRNPGFIRVSKKNPWYFEYENGRFFFPVGLNIHSNTDQRGENAFGFGHLPDRGNVDYREYIDSCSGNGINLLEIWMAAWTYAIEWSSSRSGYYGTGWYNLANAWKLDRLLEYARSKNVYISLVLDNHGKLADGCDPEWYDSPYNAKGIFAAANGAALDNPSDFWDNAEMLRATRQRNRYICARWGAEPAIFAMQLWSEVDLTAGAKKNYNKGSIIRWHKTQADFLKKHTQGKFLNASHVCGDISNTSAWRKMLVDLPEMNHVCSDAYRSPEIIISDQMLKHYEIVRKFGKPALITEFGGTSAGSQKVYQIADIHGGLWASLFARQGGSPMLWWHDFVHINNLYPHYRGFFHFIQGLDLRSPAPQFCDISITSQALFKKAERPVFEKFIQYDLKKGKKIILPEPDCFEGRALHQPEKMICGWIFRRKSMHTYPLDNVSVQPRKNIRCRIRRKLQSGWYSLFFFDTISGKLLFTHVIKLSREMEPEFPIPDLRTDIAFKMYRERTAQ